jgi:hypothetical protein
MKKRSVFFLVNLIYGESSDGKEIPEGSWEELLGKCLNFSNFKLAHHYAKDIDEKWAGIFIDGMKKTVNEENSSQLIYLLNLLDPLSTDWKEYMKKLGAIMTTDSSLSNWTSFVKLLKLLPKYFSLKLVKGSIMK